MTDLIGAGLGIFLCLFLLSPLILIVYMLIKTKQPQDLSDPHGIILLNQTKGKLMTEYTCMQCNENIVDVTELYCFHCYLENQVESMQDYELIDQLFISVEAN